MDETGPRTEAGRTELMENPLNGGAYAYEVVTRRLSKVESEARSQALADFRAGVENWRATMKAERDARSTPFIPFADLFDLFDAASLRQGDPE